MLENPCLATCVYIKESGRVCSKKRMTENGDALDDCNVFVKYLPPDVNDQELHNLFADSGKIKSAKVMFDPQTGTSLGYG